VTDWDRKVTSEHLFGWHAALFPTGRSGVTRIVAGAYRTHAEPMQIVTPRVGKPDVVHYEAPASTEVPNMMKALLRWFNTSRGEDTDGLVRAALVHLWFETVHPFEDGNGRIGRALSELALAQDMQSSQRLFSLSHQLWQDRKDYYAQLQAATGQGNGDVTAWVRWFVQHVEKACDAAVAQMEAAVGKSRFWGEINAKHPDLSASQRKVLGKLFDAGLEGFEGGMSTEKYVSLTGVSRATAYRELTGLVELGALQKIGVGKGTRYLREPS
jgi:Fic family protein